MSTYIELTNVSKKFGHFTAVNNVTLSAKKGEVLGFLGPNGAGKTTTMRMITGYLTPSEGQITVLGKNISEHPVESKSYIGYLPEGAPLYSELSPKMLLQFFAQARNLPKNLAKQRIEYVIETLHLESVFTQAIDTLSKGFKRRVGLAQAILHDPQILILDEPTDGLDPIQKHEVRQLIRQMASDKAIIISTHILEEVEAVCGRAAIINQGQLVFNDTPANLLRNHPHHHAVRLVLGNPDPTGVITALKKLQTISNVEHIALDNNTGLFTIVPSDSSSITSDVNKLAYENKWNIESLSVMHGKLDDVFRIMVTNTKT